MSELGGLPPEVLDASIEFGALDPTRWSPELLATARTIWSGRVTTEYRSAQLMSRLLADVIAIGEPLEVIARVNALVTEELRHVVLCSRLCQALGAAPPSPSDLAREDPAEMQRVPLAERVVATAISALAVNETFSVAYLRDLVDRCHEPVVLAVLQATLGNEEDHESFGWAYVEHALARYPAGARGSWRAFAERMVKTHLERADRALAEVAPELQRLECWPDDELSSLALTSDPRGALLCRRTWETELRPRLAAIGLA